MPRNPRPDPGQLGTILPSFDLCLRAAGRAPRTRRIYTDAASWLGGWLREHRPHVDRWDDVGRDDLRAFFVYLDECGYQPGYRNNIGRALQAFFKWLALEEDLPNPFGAKLGPPPPPKPGENPPEVIALAQLAALLKDAESARDYESRRDAALLRMFACTGARLGEIAGLATADVNVQRLEATVTGKARKTRTVRFDDKCALALDRYLRLRARHKHARIPALWIGLRRATGMTPSGVRQVISRRGARLGMSIHPHLFRHTFSHNWLDNGGAEGDLMELCGWESPQMLRRYGASARAARARRAYDRVDVLGGI
jgi:integrase/recombinase XerD